VPARVVRGEINTSGSLSRVSPEADLTFRALIVAVDDFGRFDARPGILKATLFPLRAAFTPEKIMRWVHELAEEGCIDLYEVDGRPFLALTGWEKHRGTSRRSGKPKYPEKQASGKSPEIREAPGNPPVNRESGVGNRESRVESSAAGAAATPTPRKAKRTGAPEALGEEDLERLALWCEAKHRALLPRLPDLVDACLTFHRGKGNVAADWYATCQTWIRNEAEQRFGPPRGSPASSGRPEPGGRAYRPFVPERREGTSVVSILGELRQAVKS
jgi:hypothetical protein